MVETLRIRHNLNWKAVVDINVLINKVINKPVLPKTTYMYKKKVSATNNVVPTYHFCCESCDLYIGTKEEIVSSKIDLCKNCEYAISIKTKYKKNYFITLPIEAQLKRIIERNIHNINLNGTSLDNGTISDVTDGLTYQSITRKLNGALFISLTTNTDGGAVFKKVKDGSFWPIQHFINEICLEERFKRDMLFCSGFWYGKTPNMSVYLRSFIDEINKINNNGGLSICIDNNVKKILIIPLFFTLDSVAKCYVLNKVQFNGYFGCPVCLHPGTLQKTTVRYSNSHNAEPRESWESKQHMLEAQIIKKSVKGFKGLSPLTAIKIIDFDLTWQMVIDKMHGMELGATRKISNLWIESYDKEYDKLYKFYLILIFIQLF